MLAPMIRPRTWHAVLSLTLPLAIPACGSQANTTEGSSETGGAVPTSGTISNPPAAGGTSANGGASAGSSASTSVFVLPESCAEFGFDVQLGCVGCPSQPPTCECLAGAGFALLPEQACTSGTCLAAVDCERLCQNFDTGFGPEWSDDVGVR